MPTLNWLYKEKIINHHQDVPFKVLEHKYGYRDGVHSEDATGSGNMIIHGDNLLALKSLLPKYQEKVDCIYIDPPYNTGNEKWVYNDNVNDPQIKKWLGEVVGAEGEDLSRHDKWLCMMYPRLKLISKLLSSDGVAAISIGFHEVNSLYFLCKELFPTKQVIIVTVQTSGGKPKEGFNYTQEYIVFVAPKGFTPNPSLNDMNAYASPYHGMNLAGFNQITRPNQVYPIYIEQETGIVKGVGLSLQELIDKGLYVGEKKDYEYDYSAPIGQVAVYPITNKGDKCVWRLNPDSFKKDWSKGYIKVVPQICKNNKNLFAVQYLADGIKKKIEAGEVETYRTSDNEDIPTIEVEDFKTGGVNISTIWTNKLYYTTRGSNELTAIFGVKGKFPYPKPMQLIKDILQRISKPNSVILDSFGGSGTTAHAVLNLNKEDGGSRKFIIVEMGDYAESVTAERVRRVITGYGKGDMKEDGTGGAFDYYELGESLFKDDGNLNEEVGEDKIREYIYFSETQQKLPERNPEKKYLMGSTFNASYYFYYTPNEKTVLSNETLRQIVNEKAEQYIIYADTCTLTEDEKAKYSVIFKKIPRDIKHF